MRLKILAKAARVNFLGASIVPFLTGMALAARGGYRIDPVLALLGALGVASGHLAGNVFNEVQDNESGADLIGEARSPFSGGSKAVKDGLVTIGGLKRLAVLFLLCALSCAAAIFFIMPDPVIPAMAVIAAVLTAAYSLPPFKLSYRRLGEIDIFLLFGVFPVAGSYYLFTGSFSAESVLVSLPVSFLITAVIFCNEVPDFPADIKAGKLTLVSVTGTKKAYLLYSALIALSYASVIANILAGRLSPYTAFLGAVYLMGARAAVILKKDYFNHAELVKASGLTVTLHLAAGAVVAAAVLIR